MVRKVLVFIVSAVFFFSLNVEKSFAHRPEHEAFEKLKEQYEALDEKQQKEVNKIFETLHKDLEKLGVRVPPLHFIEKAKKKEQLKKLIRDVEKGKMSAKEAEKEIDKIFTHKKPPHMFDNLDKKSKAEAQIILDLMKNGEISKEDGEKQLKELGVKMPKKLDEKTKKQARALIADAKKKLKKYNIDLSEKMYEHSLNH